MKFKRSVFRLKLYTEVPIPHSNNQIRLNNSVVLLGSCFAENIAQKLASNKFNTMFNPFGTLYNPISIYTIFQLIENRQDELEIYKYNSIYHCLNFSSSFQDTSLTNLNQDIMNKISEVKHFLHTTDTIIITLGTAWVYQLLDNKKIVGNCHKLPNNLFHRELLSYNEIENTLHHLSTFFSTHYPTTHVILTVSPIRHIRDNLLNNSQSKALLLAATHKVCSEKDNFTYFPSYEIMIDELRDYRFYEENLTHPTKLAKEIIWNKFREQYLSKDANSFIDDYETISKGLHHTFLDKATRKFKDKYLRKLTNLKEKFPTVDLSLDFDYFSSLKVK